jgi:uncharacterized protein GlcG (DUF336 family)
MKQLSHLVLIGAMLLPVGTAGAQTPPQSDPLMLPSQTPPPPLAMMLRYPRKQVPGAPLPAPDTTPAVPMLLALEAAQKALATCASQGLRVGVAVVDSQGQLRLGLSQDGASPGRIFGAAQKASAAAAFQQPTSVIQQRLRDDKSLVSQLKPYMEVHPGAVPLLSGGRLLGAIGASGATGEQDQACAPAGAAAIQSRLQ